MTPTAIASIFRNALALPNENNFDPTDDFRRFFDQNKRKGTIPGASKTIEAGCDEYLADSALKRYFKKNLDRIRKMHHRDRTVYTSCSPRVEETYYRVFATLLYIGRPELICEVEIRIGWKDGQFPFSTDRAPTDNVFEDSDTGAGFSEFCDAQWKFFVEPMTDLQGIRWPGEQILPFRRCEELGAGHSAKVERLEIDPEYDHLSENEGAGRNAKSKRSSTAPRSYALKTFHIGETQEDWQKEARSHIALRASAELKEDGCIIGFHGHFIHGSTLNVLLEYSEMGNLEDYMKTQPPPKDPRDIWRFWVSWLRLISTLNLVREIKFPKTDADEEDRAYQFCHFDLKPNNILVFPGDTGEPYDLKFKIGDLGSSTLHSRQDGHEQKHEQSAGTRTYGAPECCQCDPWRDEQLHKADVSPDVDVWSYACITSEIATWIVRDHNCLRQYREMRIHVHGWIKGWEERDCFHNGITVLKQVSDHHKYLKNDLKGRNTTGLVLDLIDKHMLQPTGVPPQGPTRIVGEKRRKQPRELIHLASELRATAEHMLDAPLEDMTHYFDDAQPGHGVFDSPTQYQSPQALTPQSPSPLQGPQEGQTTLHPNSRSLEPGSQPLPVSELSTAEGKRPRHYSEGTPGSHRPHRLRAPQADPGSSRSNPDVPKSRYRLPVERQYRDRPPQIHQFTQSAMSEYERLRMEAAQAGAPWPNLFFAGQLANQGFSPVEDRSKFQEMTSPYSKEGWQTQAVDRPFKTPTPEHDREKQEQERENIGKTRTVSQTDTDNSTTKTNSNPDLPDLSVPKGFEWKEKGEKPAIFETIVEGVTRSKKRRNNGDDRWRHLHGLNDRDCLFLVDDSSSMSKHWPKVSQCVDLLSFFTTVFDKDGIEIQMMTTNAKIKTRDPKTARDFIDRHPAAEEESKVGSDINTSLGKVLGDYQERLRMKYGDSKRHSFRIHSPSSKLKALTVFVLTDGRCGDAPSAEEPIRSMVQTLQSYGLSKMQVGIQLIRFGEDPDGIKLLDRLDTFLADFDIVDVEPYPSGNVYKMLLGSIIKKYDYANEVPASGPELSAQETPDTPTRGHAHRPSGSSRPSLSERPRYGS